jgi:Ankyrin repeats (3 copies)
MIRITDIRIVRAGGVILMCSLALMISACGRDKQWDLTDAAARGDLAEVKRLFEVGADLDAYPQEGGTEGGSPALHEAASAGHDEVVRFFVEHDANLEMGFSDSGTPLAGALRHYSTAKLLLDHGASANNALGQILDKRSHQPPLDDQVFELLKQHGAITSVAFKKVPATSFLCVGQVVSEEQIPAFLDKKVPELYATMKAAGAKPAGLLHVNYTGRNLRHPGPFYVELAVPFDNDKHRVPDGFYYRTATEFKCFTGKTSGLWKNIRCGAGIIESKLWSEGKAYPTFDMREVYQVWKSANSAENVAEIQFGIHRPARDIHGNRYQEADHFDYEAGE